MRYTRALLLVLLLSGCDADPIRPEGPQAPTFVPLTSRSAVLNNVEVGWNKRRADKIDDLLDANFIFFFAAGDVGGSIPSSWDRAEELATTEALFTSNTAPSPTGPVCRAVRIDLLYDDTLVWDPVVPASAPSETWYTATMFYTFTFEMEPDNTFIAQNGAKAEFTVRQVGEEWRLVEWRDLGSTIVATSSGAEADQSTTWGGVKALYR